MTEILRARSLVDRFVYLRVCRYGCYVIEHFFRVSIETLGGLEEFSKAMLTLDCVSGLHKCVWNSPKPPVFRWDHVNTQKVLYCFTINTLLFVKFIWLKFKYSKLITGSRNKPDSTHLNCGCQFREFIPRISTNCDALYTILPYRFVFYIYIFVICFLVRPKSITERVVKKYVIFRTQHENSLDRLRSYYTKPHKRERVLSFQTYQTMFAVWI